MKIKPAVVEAIGPSSNQLELSLSVLLKGDLKNLRPEQRFHILQIAQTLAVDVPEIDDDP